MSTKTLRGMRDILPDETPLWQRAEAVARDFLARYGFEEIRTPIVEEAKLFSRTLGETTNVVEKEMYEFSDREGRELVLRPEATASVVRAYIEAGRAQNDPIARYYYIGPMYRYERPQRGRYREFFQLGVEVLGVASPLIDAEVIHMLGKYFAAVGLKQYELQINSLGCPLCRPKFIDAFKAFLALHKAALCNDCQRRMDRNPLRTLDCQEEGCRTLTESAPSIQEFLCKGCEKHMDEVLTGLGDLGSSYKINPRIVRGLDYYLKTTFEFVCADLGAQKAVAGGGRYDGLVAGLGGPNSPGFGVAVGLDRLVELLKMQEAVVPVKSPLVFLVPLGVKAMRESYRLQEELRAQGMRAGLDYEGRSLKAQMRQADKLGAAWVVILGDDEIKAEAAVVKEMATGKQKNVPLKGLVQELNREIHRRT